MDAGVVDRAFGAITLKGTSGVVAFRKFSGFGFSIVDACEMKFSGGEVMFRSAVPVCPCLRDPGASCRPVTSSVACPLFKDGPEPGVIL